MSSPSSILQKWLVDNGYFTDFTSSGSWPLFDGYMPDGGDAPNDCGVIFNTTPILHSKDEDGSRPIHYGIQIRVRSRDETDGFDKVNDVAEALDAIHNAAISMGSGLDYTILAVNRASGPIALGMESGARRRFSHTLNVTMAIREG